MGSASTAVTVNNAPPQIVELTAQPASIVENDSVEIAGLFSDIGTLDTHTVTIAWGDGSDNTILFLDHGVYDFAASHQYLNNPSSGSYVVSVTVADDDSGSVTATPSVVVANAPPSDLVVAFDPEAINEGGTVTLSGSFSDAGTLDTHTATIDWGDDSQQVLNLEQGARAFETSHWYPNNPPGGGAFNVSVTVSDGDHQAQTNEEFFVHNLPSVITNVTNSGPIDENAAEPDSVTVSVTAHDLGPVDTLLYEFDCNDDGTYEIEWQADNAAICSFAVTGEYTVQVRVTDGDDIATAGTIVQVNNVPPVIVAVTNDGPIDVASVATVSVDAWDPGGVADLRYEFDCNGNGIYDFGPQGEPVAPCQYTSMGEYTTKVRVTDSAGAEALGETQVVVHNLPPEILFDDPTVLDGVTVQEGQLLMLLGQIEDFDQNDSHYGVVNYGDGTSVQTLVIDEDRAFTLTHVYADDGLYTVSVTVTDSNHGQGSLSFAVEVINVPPVVLAVEGAGTIEGLALNLPAAIFTDAGSADTHQATINWGDGSPVVAGTVFEAPFGPPGSTEGMTGVFAGEHLYTISGIYSVEVCVWDDDMSQAEATCGQFPVEVENSEPGVSAGVDVTLNQGSFTSAPFWATLYANDFSELMDPFWSHAATGGLPPRYTDAEGVAFLGPLSNDTLRLRLDILPPHSQVTVAFDLLVEGGNPGQLTVGLEGESAGLRTDAFSNLGSGPQSLTLPHSEAGMVLVFTASGVDIGSWSLGSVAVNVLADRPFFLDPGINEWTATVDYGDGSGEQPLSLYPDKTFDLGHVYQGIDEYIVTVRVHDGTATGIGSFSAHVEDIPVQVEDLPSVVLGQEGVRLNQRVTVHSGAVVANTASAGPFLNSGVEMSIGQQVTFLGDSSVYGDSVHVSQRSTIPTLHYNSLQEGQEVNIPVKVTPLSLPVVELPPFPAAISPGSNNINVAQDSSLTLAAGYYGTFNINQRATIIFSGGEYHFASWNVGQQVNLYFQAPSKVHIAGQLVVGQRSVVMPHPSVNDMSASDIVIYVAGVNGSNGALSASPKAAEFGQQSNLQANVYAPNGTLLLTSQTEVRGAVIARWVDIGQDVTLTLKSAFVTPRVVNSASIVGTLPQPMSETNEGKVETPIEPEGEETTPDATLPESTVPPVTEDQSQTEGPNAGTVTNHLYLPGIARQ